MIITSFAELIFNMRALATRPNDHLYPVHLAELMHAGHDFVVGVLDPNKEGDEVDALKRFSILSHQTIAEAIECQFDTHLNLAQSDLQLLMRLIDEYKALPLSMKAVYTEQKILNHLLLQHGRSDYQARIAQLRAQQASEAELSQATDEFIRERNAILAPLRASREAAATNPNDGDLARARELFSDLEQFARGGDNALGQNHDVDPVVIVFRDLGPHLENIIFNGQIRQQLEKDLSDCLHYRCHYIMPHETMLDDKVKNNVLAAWDKKIKACAQAASDAAKPRLISSVQYDEFSNEHYKVLMLTKNMRALQALKQRGIALRQNSLLTPVQVKSANALQSEIDQLLIDPECLASVMCPVKRLTNGISNIEKTLQASAQQPKQPRLRRLQSIFAKSNQQNRQHNDPAKKSANQQHAGAAGQPTP